MDIKYSFDFINSLPYLIKCYPKNYWSYIHGVP